ncbi:MAG TPA: chromosome segregation protein SMC, partial [Candidatus Hydrogenedentes bacterium]|nr:chromosome segregation protein SMC [Candidatus Hydrogenedentota bacterium]
MYFKRIILHGFKSFADRTVLELSPGITCIVGPNGSGKSNILDALRWALGEQSAKALRGSSMQDVIFNGTAHRPAMGMAEVVLGFDNADLQLPVEYTEVEVCRRVYRDGEGEYLLNKMPTRLRDIQELFMDTGIGTNAYSLIGQGKVDMIISSRSEDRRFLFEEAAGIIKYKNRKKLAARRLESADQNMVRLGDIIAEVERQMRHLKRQVNAAARYRELTEELKTLELRNAWLQHNELLNRLDDIRMQVGDAQEKYAASSAELASLESEAEQLNLRRLELDRELAACREQEAALDAEMERAEREIALARQEISFSTRRIEEIQGECAALEQKLGADMPDLAAAHDLAALEQTLESARQELETLQSRLAEADQSARAAEEHLETLRSAATSATTARHRTESELNGVLSTLSALEQQITELRAQQSAQAELLAALAEREAAARHALQTAREVLNEVEITRSGMAGRRSELTEQARALEQARQEKRETRSALEARLRSLRELRDRYEGFAGGVRAIMLARQQGLTDMEGIIGPVGDLIGAEKGFETAIEAALGGNINNVVTRDADAAKRAIAFLKEHQAGRVTFLPLDTIRSGGTDDGEPLPGEPGVIGWATRYVSCPAELRPAMEYLLYNTAIVRDIDDAIRIARKERKYPRLVTLEGEVVSPAGAVTGGRTRHESRGLIGRAAEIEELERQVAALEHELAGLDRKIASARDELTALNESLRDMEGREAAARREVAAREKDLAAVESERAVQDRSGGRLAEQDAGLLARTNELREQAESLRKALDRMLQEEAEAQSRLEGVRGELETLRAARAALEQAVADQRVRTAEAGRALDETRRLREREERERATALEELTRRRDLITQLERRIRELEQVAADQAERIARLSAEKESAHARTLEAVQHHRVVVESLDALAERNRKTRARLDAAGQALHSA